MRNIVSGTNAVALAALLLAGSAPSARAQHGGDGYLFHAPDVRLTIRGGYALASAHSDLFDFAIQQLTLQKRDFSGLAGGIELAVPVSDRWEISADVGYSHAGASSEFRNFLDNNNAPIQQTTTFDRVPVTLNARYYLTAPGRAIGKLAWIPARVAPWIGAGAGEMYYRFGQQGDFVDFQNNNVFQATFESTAWTPAVQAMGGFDYTITPMIALTTDARYIWARGTVNKDFSGFDNIDLSGVSASVGLTFRL